jgi:hypothetical protein
VLELFQHVLRGDDQDAVAPAAADEFGQQQPDLQRLPQPDDIGHQDPWAEPGQGQRGGPLLVDHRPEQERVGERQPAFGPRQGRAAQHRLQVEPAAPEAGRRIGDQLGVLGMQQRHLVQAVEERRLLVPDELRGADDLHQIAVVSGPHGTPHQPFLVADEDPRPRCVRGLSLRFSGRRRPGDIDLPDF